jgi:hypothetical protein
MQAVQEETKQKSRTKFNLSIPEMLEVQFNCNVLKDFSHISFDEGMMLHKNTVIIKNQFDKLRESGNLLDERNAAIQKEGIRLTDVNAVLNKRSESGEDGKKILPDREKYNADLEKNNKNAEENRKKISEYNTKKHDIFLNTIPFESFPKDREKYDKKLMTLGQQQREIDRYASLQELLGTIVTENEEL